MSRPQHAASSANGHSASSMPRQSLNTPPPGTFVPGTKVQVGSHRVIIQKYLSEGGFAHVYVVRILSPGTNKDEIAVLKRVAVPDTDALGSMRTEVDTMKKLHSHKHIVQYIDSHASQLKGGGFEVFLLMEFCAGGGLIDFMNTRLQHRLTEPEILKIFGDVGEGVATMHYLKPPLLHRDLKVENILISKPPTAATSGVIYKLCDFGSTALPQTPAKDAAEARLIENDVQRHTTMQYRSPEMVDVWRRQPIDEKSDIWALGVLLYKLCYYTTPFEEVGQMAILNATFKYPSHPPFSDRLKALIGGMLREDPKERPNIYQVVSQVSAMTGRRVPFRDIYTTTTKLESDQGRHKDSRPNKGASAVVPGITHSTLVPTSEVLPHVTPMRRGRPASAAAKKVEEPKSVPSTLDGDPFARLDSTSKSVSPTNVEDVARKYPSIDDFAIAHDPQPDIQPQPAAPLRKQGSQDRIKSNPHQATLSLLEIDPANNSNLSSRPSASSLGTKSPMPTNTKPDRPIWHVPDLSRSSSQSRFGISHTEPLVSKTSSLISSSDGPASNRPSVEGLKASQVVGPSSGIHGDDTNLMLVAGSNLTVRKNPPTEDESSGVAAYKPSQPTQALRRKVSELQLLELSATEAPSLSIARPVGTASTEPKSHARDVGSDDEGPKSSEARRERERQQLLEEEERVSKAASEYRQGAKAKNLGGSRASMIQTRMKTFLDDPKQGPSPKRTAEGYGRYTDKPSKAEVSSDATTASGSGIESSHAANHSKLPVRSSSTRSSNTIIRMTELSPSMSAPPDPGRAFAKPATRPKPISLRAGLSSQPSSPTSAAPDPSRGLPSPRKSPSSIASPQSQSRLAALLAKDQVGVAAPGAGLDADDANSVAPASASISATGTDLDLAAFTNRYPSVGGLDVMELQKPSSLEVRDI